MTKIKKILFPVFSLFLLQQTFEIIKQVLASSPGDFGFRETLFVAFLLTLYVTGIFAFTGFAYPTSSILPASWYVIKKPKRLERICKLLGVKYFRFFLLLFFWGRKKNARKYFNGTRLGLQNFNYQTKQSEFGHLAAFVIVSLLSLFLLSEGYYLIVALAAPINVFGNLYPVLLQRYHRIRISKLV